MHAERDRLRRALQEVRLAPAYEQAVQKGIDAAVAAWPGSSDELRKFAEAMST